jgi:hypothetical protein
MIIFMPLLSKDGNLQIWRWPCCSIGMTLSFESPLCPLTLLTNYMDQQQKGSGSICQDTYNVLLTGHRGGFDKRTDVL